MLRTRRSPAPAVLAGSGSYEPKRSSRYYERDFAVCVRAPPCRRTIWNFGCLRTDIDADIDGVATSHSTGFFFSESVDAPARNRERHQTIATSNGGLRLLQPWSTPPSSRTDPTPRATFATQRQTSMYSIPATADRHPHATASKGGDDYTVTRNGRSAACSLVSDQYVRATESIKNEPCRAMRWQSPQTYPSPRISSSSPMCRI